MSDDNSGTPTTFVSALISFLVAISLLSIFLILILRALSLPWRPLACKNRRYRLSLAITPFRCRWKLLQSLFSLRLSFYPISLDLVLRLVLSPSLSDISEWERKRFSTFLTTSIHSSHQASAPYSPFDVVNLGQMTISRRAFAEVFFLMLCSERSAANYFLRSDYSFLLWQE